jgi:hypothetical protein
VQDNSVSGFKLAFGFIAVAVPLLSIAAYGGAVVARKPVVEKKIASVEKTEGQADEMVTASIKPKPESSCKAGKLDIRQRSSKFDFSMAFGGSQSSVGEPAP